MAPSVVSDAVGGGAPPPAPYDRRRLLRVLDAVVLYLAACALFIALREDGGWRSTAAIWAVALLGIWMTRVIRLEVRRTDTPHRIRWMLLLVPLAVGAVLLWLWVRTNGADGWGFFGVATFAVGVGLLIS